MEPEHMLCCAGSRVADLSYREQADEALSSLKRLSSGANASDKEQRSMAMSVEAIEVLHGSSSTRIACCIG
jgi:hypothetical protein